MFRAFCDSESSGLGGEGFCQISHKQFHPGLAWENEGRGPGPRRRGLSWGCPGISPVFGGQLRGARAELQGRAGCPGECDSVGLGWRLGRGWGVRQAAAGWESGLVSCLEGKGPAEGSGGSSRQAHIPAFSPPSSPFYWKSEVIVSPGWGGLDGDPKLEEVALRVGPHLRLCPTPWAHSPKSSFPSLFFKLSRNPSQKSSNLQTNSRTLWNLHEASPPCPLPAVPAPQALMAHRFSVPRARDVGGGWGGARAGMKGPFSSTAGRTAAIKARLDTLCPEASLQLACPPWTPLHLAFLSFHA